jgi:type II secretory pathway component PulK
MDTRYLFSALIGAFCLVAIFAAITTARHLSQREGAAGALKTKQSRQAEHVRLTALHIGSGRARLFGGTMP